MYEVSETILREYQIRKTKAQKAAFRACLMADLEEKGFSVREEKAGMGGVNLVVGDIERASCVFSAHYDTCAVLPVPNFLAPKNIPLSLLYQLFLVLLIFAAAAVVGAISGFISAFSPVLGSLIFLVGMVALCLGMVFGPANKHTANDNTSGVITLVEALCNLPEGARGRAAFVFFDNEEKGLLGSSAFRKMHATTMETRPLINFDCVSDGDLLLFIPNKAFLADTALSEKLEASARMPEGKRAEFRPASKTLYPSDQMSYRKSVAVVALQHSKYFGDYISRIHTRRDTQFDRVNIDTLQHFIIRMITEDVAKPGCNVAGNPIQ